jgi:hypothetical protein
MVVMDRDMATVTDTVPITIMAGLAILYAGMAGGATMADPGAGAATMGDGAAMDGVGGAGAVEAGMAEAPRRVAVLAAADCMEVDSEVDDDLFGSPS